MTAHPDLVIRGGTIADGTAASCSRPTSRSAAAASPRSARSRPRARKRSTPGANWSRPASSTSTPITTARSPGASDITPSSQNGVTTAIMGNCGVGFAPCRPADHQRLIQLMEGVEDIPEPVLSAGIPWALGKLSGLHGLAVEAAVRHGHRRATAARGAARLCDGRARRAPRSRHAPRTTARWRRSPAMRCAPARSASRPRAPSTTAPRPAITRRP